MRFKQFVKPDSRKSGKFCLLCFIEEMHKSQLAIVDTDVLSEAEVNDHIAKIKNTIGKSYGASYNKTKDSEKHGKKHPLSQLDSKFLFIKSVADLIMYCRMYHLGILEGSNGATNVDPISPSTTHEEVRL